MQAGVLAVSPYLAARRFLRHQTRARPQREGKERYWLVQAAAEARTGTARVGRGEGSFKAKAVNWRRGSAAGGVVPRNVRVAEKACSQCSHIGAVDCSLKAHGRAWKHSGPLYHDNEPREDRGCERAAACRGTARATGKDVYTYMNAKIHTYV